VTIDFSHLIKKKAKSLENARKYPDLAIHKCSRSLRSQERQILLPNKGARQANLGTTAHKDEICGGIPCKAVRSYRQTARGGTLGKLTVGQALDNALKAVEEKRKNPAEYKTVPQRGGQGASSFLRSAE
jgi:hypothetical protein